MIVLGYIDVLGMLHKHWILTCFIYSYVWILPKKTAFSGFGPSHAHTKGNNRLEKLRVPSFFFAVTQELVHYVEEMKQKEIHLLAGHSWKSFTHQNIGSINMYEWVKVVGVHWKTCNSKWKPQVWEALWNHKWYLSSLFLLSSLSWLCVCVRERPGSGPLWLIEHMVCAAQVFLRKQYDIRFILRISAIISFLQFHKAYHHWHLYSDVFHEMYLFSCELHSFSSLLSRNLLNLPKTQWLHCTKIYWS